MTNSPHRQPLSVRSFIAGMHEGYAVTQHGGRQHGVEVLLGPLAARRLLGVPMDEQRRTRRRPTTLPRPLQLRSTPHRTQAQAPQPVASPPVSLTSRHRTASSRRLRRSWRPLVFTSSDEAAQHLWILAGVSAGIRGGCWLAGAQAAVVAYSVLLLVFLPELRGPWRPLAILFAVMMVLGIGFSRVALGVHYVSDVLAGSVLGAAWVAAMTAAFAAWRRERGQTQIQPTRALPVRAPIDSASVGGRDHHQRPHRSSVVSGEADTRNAAAGRSLGADDGQLRLLGGRAALLGVVVGAVGGGGADPEADLAVRGRDPFGDVEGVGRP
jgi:hypothetical protein